MYILQLCHSQYDPVLSDVLGLTWVLLDNDKFAIQQVSCMLAGLGCMSIFGDFKTTWRAQEIMARSKDRPPEIPGQNKLHN